jgi:hypothetical protein
MTMASRRLPLIGAGLIAAALALGAVGPALAQVGPGGGTMGG